MSEDKAYEHIVLRPVEVMTHCDTRVCTGLARLIQGKPIDACIQVQEQTGPVSYSVSSALDLIAAGLEPREIPLGVDGMQTGIILRSTQATLDVRSNQSELSTAYSRTISDVLSGTIDVLAAPKRVQHYLNQ